MIINEFFFLSLYIDDSLFKQANAKNENLVDRLKSVKVDAFDKNPEPQFGSEEEQLKRQQILPKDRFGAPLPYVFYKPEQMPVDKITVLDILDIILSHKQDKHTIEEIAAHYQLSEVDIKNLIEYVDVFTAIDKDDKEIQLFVKRDYDVDEDTTIETIESGFKSKKSKKTEEITDK